MKHWRKKTPTVIQMEAVECGAACLAIILGHYKRYVPLEKLRQDCGVSRDGSNALNMIKAAVRYGLKGRGYQKTFDEIFNEESSEFKSPMVVLWEYNHFLVVEGFDKKRIFLNDPASGPRTVSYEEFEEGYSGIVITFIPTDQFEEGGAPPRIMKDVLKHIKGVRLPLFYLFLVGLCLLLPGLALPALARVFVDRILVSHIDTWKWMLLSSIGVVALIGGTLFWLQSYFLLRLSIALGIKLSSRFLWHILRLPIFFYTQRYPAEIAYRTTLNDEISKVISGTLTTTCINLLLIIFYGIVILTYDLTIGLVAFAAVIINFLIFSWIQRSRSDAYSRVQQEMGKWIGNALGALQHIETIKATGLESDFFARFSGYYAKNLNAQQEIGRKDAILGVTPYLLQALAMAALLAIGSLHVIEGKLTFGMLIALQTLLINFLTPVANFVNFGQTMQNIKVDISRLDDVMNNQIDPIYKERQDARIEKRETKLEGYLEFCGVTFGYSPLDPPLIENLSFVIKPGERLALVGPSGCGKSTIAKLSVGLYRPWSGKILYDGKELKEIAPEVFYHSLGHVDQEIFLFSGTIRENLTLWNPTIADEMLITAAHDAAIHDEILLRKEGYDALLTEGGRNLSGGQRQRLEIARALLYSPSLLVLDEATSALDSNVEKEISDRIRRRGCTAVMIAHRLSTIQDCNEILVLDKGKVVQRGTHQDLKKQSGIYKNLIESESI